MTPRIGAHVSIDEGHSAALDRIAAMGGNCLQIFSISPMAWQRAKLADDAIQTFINRKQELGIDPVYFHATYLVNLADTDRIGQSSVKALISELELASRMKIRGSIVHLGSFKEKEKENPMMIDLFPDKYKTLVENIGTIIEATPDDTVFILENAGNRKIGRTMDEVFRIVKDIQSNRLKVCLDTCHLHAAGYKLDTRDDFERFLDIFDKGIGLEKIELWHMNDSRDPFGSLRDRHENLGEGFVGITVFQNIATNPATKHIPMIIETPGFDNKGPDKENLDILKGFI